MQKEYVTTNVRLHQSWHKKLKHKAMESNMSFAELVREALRRQYALTPPILNKKAIRQEAKSAFFKELLQMARPMGGKISANIDNILYGKIRH